jgi:predicted ferric reductase
MRNHNILSAFGWWILSILSLAPLLMWIFETPINYRFANLSLFARSLGDVAGLVGFSMFALVLILSARLKIFDKLFKGINESYTAHHFFGGLAFSLLLLHPLLLAYNYLLISFRSAALFLLPGQNMAQNFGIFGLFSMIITLVITFYTKLKYQIWKFTHKFLGLAFIFAFFHVFLIGADVMSNYWLKVYLFVLSTAAILTYFYRTLFSDYFVRVFDYTVKEVKPFPDKIWEIEFEPNPPVGRKAINFFAGQFAFIKLYSKHLPKEPHPFSFSSSPENPLRIAVKELGDYTNKIGSLKPGDKVKIEGPFGAFNFRNCKNKKQIWIAGGIGIVPFLSMLRDLSAKDSDYDIDLYYSVKDENCLAFQEEIEDIADKNKNLKVKFWNTALKKFVNAKHIKEATEDFWSRDIFICGPQIMMDSLKTQFLELGLKEKALHIEEFQLY